MATRYKIIILLNLLIFCIHNIQATAPRLQGEQQHTILPPSSQINSQIRPTQSSPTEPPNQPSAYASSPRPDYHLSKAYTFIRAFLATPLSTHLSNSIVIIKSHLAAALATARDTCITALTQLKTQARTLLDLCKKNVRYLQAAREHERRLIVQSQEPLPNMTADGEPPSSRKLAPAMASTRPQSIAAVAALAGIETQDVFTVVLWLEKAVRAVERFRQVQMPSYVGVAGRVWRGIVPTIWVDALYTRVKTGLSVAAFAGGVTVLLGAWMDKGVRRLVMGVLGGMVVLVSWRWWVSER